MQQRRLEPNVIRYNSSISSCEKGQQWLAALELLLQMWQRRLEPNAITQIQISSIISCEKGQLWLAVLELTRLAQYIASFASSSSSPPLVLNFGHMLSNYRSTLEANKRSKIQEKDPSVRPSVRV